MKIRIAPHLHYLAEMDLDYPQSEATERIVFEVTRPTEPEFDCADGNTVVVIGNTLTRENQDVVRLEYLLCGFMGDQDARPIYQFDQVLDEAGPAAANH